MVEKYFGNPRLEAKLKMIERTIGNLKTGKALGAQFKQYLNFLNGLLGHRKSTMAVGPFFYNALWRMRPYVHVRKQHGILVAYLYDGNRAQALATIEQGKIFGRPWAAVQDYFVAVGAVMPPSAFALAVNSPIRIKELKAAIGV